VAPGSKELRKIQWGLEGTAGTATAATAIWRGPATSMVDALEVVESEEQIGIIGGADRTHIPKVGATLTVPETEATFEQLPYPFAMLYGGATTGVADGSGSSGYKYLTTIPTTAKPTAKTYTVETGDDFEAEEMEHAVAVSVTVSGVAGEAVKVTFDLIGRRATRVSFTGAISLPTVEDILASSGALYLDAIGGTIGTTAVSNQLLSFSITFEAMWVPKHTVDGQLYFTFLSFANKRITGELTFEHDTITSGSGGGKADWRAQTAKLMRLQFTGSSYATAGSGTTFTAKKGLRIDLPIKWLTWSEIGDQDGNDTITATFVSKYNATAGNAGSVLITNELAALP
jgi:hypothetical protein